MNAPANESMGRTSLTDEQRADARREAVPRLWEYLMPIVGQPHYYERTARMASIREDPVANATFRRNFLLVPLANLATTCVVLNYLINHCH